MWLYNEYGLLLCSCCYVEWKMNSEYQKSLETLCLAFIIWSCSTINYQAEHELWCVCIDIDSIWTNQKKLNLGLLFLLKVNTFWPYICQVLCCWEVSNGLDVLFALSYWVTCYFKTSKFNLILSKASMVCVWVGVSEQTFGVGDLKFCQSFLSGSLHTHCEIEWCGSPWQPQAAASKHFPIVWTVSKGTLKQITFHLLTSVRVMSSSRLVKS